MTRFAFALFSTALGLTAQAPNSGGDNPPSGFSVPTLGFVASQTPVQLRPILGIPGSARLGRPLPLPRTVTQIHVAPGQAFAIVEQDSSNHLSLIPLPRALVTQTLALKPIAGAMGRIDLLAFSPTGVSAVIYSRQTNHLQVLTGFPRTPRVSLNVLKLELPSPPQRLAVSDDGQAVLLSDAAGSVYSLRGEAALEPVHYSPDISILEFVARSREAVIGDRFLNSAALLQGSAIKPVPLAPTAAGLCQPEAGVSTADGRTILVACPAQNAILSIDRASGLTRVHHMPNTPVALNRLSAGDVFLMYPPQGDTYWLVVWGPRGPVRFFIAAAREIAQESSN